MRLLNVSPALKSRAEVRTVRGIGIELGFKAEASVLVHQRAALAGDIVEEVSGVELNTGHIGSYFHNAPALGVVCSRKRTLRIGIYAEIVVISAVCKLYLGVCAVDISADSLHLSEIERRFGDVSYLAGGYTVRIHGGVVRAGQAKLLREDIRRLYEPRLKYAWLVIFIGVSSVQTAS